METLRRRLLASTIIAGVLAVAGAAYAQTPADDAPLPTTNGAETEVEGLVVTGSRIPTTEFTSSQPIQVIDTVQAPLRGVADIGQLLQQSSVAAGSPQINSTISSAFVTDGGPGAATVSLRGLGANRTLVLLNGRRAGPAGTRGGVSAFDLNVLPLSIIDRVEILKDGASSVYGSDAVAGVVNIFTRRNQNGFNFDAFASAPRNSGGAEYRVSGSWGRTWDGGHFQIAADYYNQRQLRRRDRNYTNCAEQYIFDPATGARRDVIDPSTGQPKCRDTLWGQLWMYDYDPGFSDDSSFLPGRVPVPRVLLQFDANGSALAAAPGAAFPAPRDPGDLIAPGGWIYVENPNSLATYGITQMDHPFIRAASIIPETRRYTVYADGAVDVGRGMEAYGEVLLNRRMTSTVNFRQFWDYNYTEDFFDFYGGAGGDPFSAGFRGPWLLSPTGITDHFGQSQRVDYGRVVIGLRGQLGGNWRYDVYGQFSRSDGNYSQDVILDDAINSQSFRTGSCVGTNLPISGRPCIDLPWTSPRFLAGDFTAAERAFLLDRETGNTKYSQASIEATVAGTLFHLPAGPVGAAFGATTRYDFIRDVPGQITAVGNSWGLSSAGVTTGDDYTNELFAELQVPLLRDAPFAERLNLQLSGRYTDVRTAGDNFTYRVGLDWTLTEWFRVRGSYGTSFRAPALFENYLAAQTDFISQRSIDPCINWGPRLADQEISQQLADNCAADGVPANHNGAGSTATVSASGGLGALESETSRSAVIGVILTPRFANLSIALDYFDIEVRNEVTRLGPGNVVLGCYQSDSFPTDPLCNLFTRNGANLIDFVTDNYINISDQRNRGLDLTIRYQREFPWFDFTYQGQFTYQLTDTTALFPGTETDDNGDVGDPKFVGNSTFRFVRGPWTLFWGVDIIGPSSDVDDCPSASCLGENIDTSVFGPYRAVIDTPWVFYHSLSVQREFDRFRLTVGVANLLDENPPRVTTINDQGNFDTVGQSVLASQYDYVGRRFFMNFNVRF